METRFAVVLTKVPEPDFITNEYRSSFSVSIASGIETSIVGIYKEEDVAWEKAEEVQEENEDSGYIITVSVSRMELD